MDIGGISSIQSELYKSSSDQSASRLQDSLKTDYSKASDDELMTVCKEFESYFLEQIMKEMWKTVSTEESSGSASMLKEYYQDEMIQNMAAQSTEQNSLGLAQMLYEQMKRNYGL